MVNTLDNKLVNATIFVDQSKAFDTMDHSLLLKCLETIGFDWESSSKTDSKMICVTDVKLC